jgi:16S rRNA processing protein RimM
MTLPFDSAEGKLARGEVLVGRITGTFGVRGELKCDPTSAGRTAVSSGSELRCARGDATWAIRVEAIRPHKGRLLIRIEGVEDSDAAAAYAGAVLYAPREAIHLSEGEYLDDDLVGCAVQSADGTPYGTVERVEHYPSSDMLVVDDVMVPMVRAIVVDIDLNRRRIVVDPPAGLF